MIVVFVGIIGIGANVYAHREHGGGWGGGGQYGGCMRYQDGSDAYGDKNPLSEKDYKALEQQRESFLNETKELRTGLSEKGRELQDEMAKSTPDLANASQLQKEISVLQSRLDQKRVEHMIEMRKLNPNAGQGMMSRRSGMRSGMGPGSGRGGCCSW
jgi:hypothetical protein